ncbi:hypothetical protein TRFO_13303 [Tritrichomonas foetus]|uniref:Uncharacterized protein n=1 Tax=Tritrichomonas foetus TaxID=1144522 RepID=A0A1J4KYI3_9EUKA|nr:hypothetical protein TRFO_13303 [Tritrichomonas foetus]|eukprot:OHT16295.1 hypothetical protein TRFO_13303 [Tritrichomonas foetus]
MIIRKKYINSRKQLNHNLKTPPYLRKFLIIFIINICIIIYYFQYQLSDIHISDYNILTKLKRVLIVVQTYHKHENRQQYHLQNWMMQLPDYLWIDAAFVSDVPIFQGKCNNTKEPICNSKLYHTIIVPKHEYNIRMHLFKNLSRQLTQVSFILTLNQSLRYFLKTESDYIIRVDDDVSFYLPNLKKAIDELDSHFDPKTDKVLKGLCVSCGPFFYGGGAGQLFSRAAAEDVLTNFDEWGLKIDVPWDVYLNTLAERFKIPLDQMTLGGMTSGFQSYFYEIAAKGEWNKFEQCPARNFDSSRCPGPFHRVKDIFTFHHFSDFFSQNTTWEKILGSGTIPDNLFYHNCNWACHPCLAPIELQNKHPKLFLQH